MIFPILQCSNQTAGYKNMNYKDGNRIKHFLRFICWSDNPVDPGAHGDIGARMDNISPQGKNFQSDIFS